MRLAGMHSARFCLPFFSLQLPFVHPTTAQFPFTMSELSVCYGPPELSTYKSFQESCFEDSRPQMTNELL